MGISLTRFTFLRSGLPFNLILSNPPYITSSEIRGLSREVRDYEPNIALNGGTDGLTFYRNIISQTPVYLKREDGSFWKVGKPSREGL